MVSVQEVPKRADRNPNTTFYLWTIKHDQVGPRLPHRQIADLGMSNLIAHEQVDCTNASLFAVWAVHGSQVLRLDRLSLWFGNVDVEGRKRHTSVLASVS